MDNAAEHKAAEHWDSMLEWRTTQPSRIRWWESETIHRVINKRICGEPVPGADIGLVELMRRRIKPPLRRGVSVGCGNGGHEMLFIHNRLVQTFDLYDISRALIDQGKQMARDQGVADSCNFKHEDAFQNKPKGDYDLVFWGSSLHHMPDVEKAVKWSYDSLRPGGWFVMNEYIGEDRFQWSRRTMACVNLSRVFLPEAVFFNKVNPKKPLSRYLKAPTLQEMEYDPSEAMDSERIVPTVKRYFPKATIKNVGGAIYHIGLSDILTNIPEDSWTLRLTLAYDRLVSFFARHYAIAIAQKPK